MNGGRFCYTSILFGGNIQTDRVVALLEKRVDRLPFDFDGIYSPIPGHG